MKSIQSKVDEVLEVNNNSKTKVRRVSLAKRKLRVRLKFLLAFLTLIFIVFSCFSLGFGVKPATEEEPHYLSETLGYDASAPREPDGEPQNPESGDNAISVIDRTKKPETPGEKIIHLTFDDGPGPYTAKLLDILKKHNVKATFFVTGAGDDALITREYNEGHAVGLHTYTHDYALVYSSVANFFADLYRVQDRVRDATGYTSTLIRFPGGSSNGVSAYYDGGIHIMSQLVGEVSARGFTYFDWNVSSGDAGGATSPDQVYQNVTDNLKPTSSVVLQHDIKEFSVDAVERIIEYGQKNGYTFKKLDETSFAAHHGVNN
ncbi:polysaccharide deacetylase [Candidatus Saccharibacteria bacterium]|nr:polysaccharide deacetylase [Candidatus Saccharibacteria bacterium]